MTLVYAGTCCHAPGMTSRAEMAAPETRKQLHDAFARQRQALIDTGTEALVMVQPPNTCPANIKLFLSIINCVTNEDREYFSILCSKI